ncbi:MAG: YfcC family protein, partial [Alphaproteobacteria bacterium]|nr:YfcC family protein [Alphaproteobacteria bacterium]
MDAKKSTKVLHPLVVMIFVILAGGILTYIVGAGSFERHGALVIPGTYHAIPKDGGWQALFSLSPAAPAGKSVHAASIASVFMSIPEGLAKNASLIFMVMFVGGMFGVLRRTGAIDAGADRLIHATSSNLNLLVPILMMALALGSTFLGFISEYLVLIPIVAIVGERLGYGPMFAAAIVGVAAKVGYATSVTNPLALIIAQPLAHVPLFSGIGFRLALFVVFISLGIAYVVVYLRFGARTLTTEAAQIASGLSHKQSAVLLALLLAGIVLVFGSVIWGWHENEIGAYYIGLSFIFALLGGLSAREAA